MPNKLTRTIENLNALSKKNRKQAEAFISLLLIKEELEATREVMSDKELVESIRRGEADFKAGRFKSWKAVKGQAAK